MQPSPERLMYNGTILPKVKSLLSPNSKVLDIGKSITWDYKNCFAGYRYQTIDINANVHPDLVGNMENVLHEFKGYDLVLCNGVVEQCSNPFNLIIGAWSAVIPGGLLMIGSVSTGYPVYQSADFFRFTENGLRREIEKTTMKIVEWITVKRGDVVSYIFAICKN